MHQAAELERVVAWRQVSSEMKLKVYMDGASRGNPGPSAIAFIILDQDGRKLREHSEYVGVGTNNQAEYKALISALESAVNFGDELTCCMDSELVVKQMNGEYRINDLKMRNLWRQAVALREKFRKATFVHVPRVNLYIERVDQLANEVLDRISLQTPSNSISKGNRQLKLTDY